MTTTTMNRPERVKLDRCPPWCDGHDGAAYQGWEDCDDRQERSHAGEEVQVVKRGIDDVAVVVCQLEDALGVLSVPDGHAVRLPAGGPDPRRGAQVCRGPAREGRPCGGDGMSVTTMAPSITCPPWCTASEADHRADLDRGETTITHFSAETPSGWCIVSRTTPAGEPCPNDDEQDVMIMDGDQPLPDLREALNRVVEILDAVSDALAERERLAGATR
jgi:hypothetical protein